MISLKIWGKISRVDVFDFFPRNDGADVGMTVLYRDGLPCL